MRSSVTHTHTFHITCNLARVYVMSRLRYIRIKNHSQCDTDLGSSCADTCKRSPWAGKAAANCRTSQDTINAGNGQPNRCSDMTIHDFLKQTVPMTEQATDHIARTISTIRTGRFPFLHLPHIRVPHIGVTHMRACTHTYTLDGKEIFRNKSRGEINYEKYISAWHEYCTRGQAGIIAAFTIAAREEKWRGEEETR